MLVFLIIAAVLIGLAYADFCLIDNTEHFGICFTKLAEAGEAGEAGEVGVNRGRRFPVELSRRAGGCRSAFHRRDGIRG